MSTPKYPNITVNLHHRGSDPTAVMMAVVHALDKEEIPASDRTQYLDAILEIVKNNDLTTGQRAVAVAKESMKWVALTD
jgi:hypothetical protein